MRRMGGPRREYDSPLRRQRAAQTRERILAAGSDLAHESATWDWAELTYRAVAERAGVGLRTVYRYFPTERQLHDAIMARLEGEAGVTYDGLALEDVAAVATRIFSSLSAFSAREAGGQRDGTVFQQSDLRRRAALLACLDEAAPRWTAGQRRTAAALLDVLWNLPSFERLAGPWELDTDRATAALSWLIGRVLDAVERDEPPPG